MSKPKTTTRKPRRKAMNVDNVVAMVAFRDHMRQQAAAQRAFQKANAPWRRITAKLVTLVIVAACTFVVVSHAMAISG